MNQLQVAGVICIGEHGDYPSTPDTQQKMYPRRRFFDGVAETFRRVGAVVPVFNDKHVGFNWEDATHMVQDSGGEAVRAFRRLVARDQQHDSHGPTCLSRRTDAVDDGCTRSRDAQHRRRRHSIRDARTRDPLPADGLAVCKRRMSPQFGLRQLVAAFPLFMAQPLSSSERLAWVKAAPPHTKAVTSHRTPRGRVK